MNEEITFLHSETLLTHNLHASNRTHSLLSKRVPAPLPSGGQNATNAALKGMSIPLVAQRDTPLCEK